MLDTCTKRNILRIIKDKIDFDFFIKVLYSYLLISLASDEQILIRSNLEQILLKDWWLKTLV